jgi:hypothetical protein
MTYYEDDKGECRFTAFLKTEIVSGSPVTYAYMGGLFNYQPDKVTTYIVQNSGVKIVYTTEDPPKIAFNTVNVVHNGLKYPCLIVSVKDGTSALSEFRSYLIDIRMINGSESAPVSPPAERNVTPWGYITNWDYSSTSDTVEAPTGYSFVNRWAHGIRLYWVNDNNVEGLMQDLYGETLIDMLNSAKYKLITGIICLHKIPLTPDHGTTESPTIFGKRLGSNLLNSCSKILKQVYTIPGSPVTLEGISQSAFDYSRYSSLHVRLPFVGTVPIDIDAVMDGTIKTVYHIDILTGNCMAQIFCQNSYNGAEILLFQGGGNCAIPIPYSGNDQGGMKQLGSYLGLAGGVVAGALTGGSAAPVIGSAASAFMLGSPAATTAHYTPTEISTLGSKKVCYILVSRSV